MGANKVSSRSACRFGAIVISIVAQTFTTYLQLYVLISVVVLTKIGFTTSKSLVMCNRVALISEGPFQLMYRQKIKEDASEQGTTIFVIN